LHLIWHCCEACIELVEGCSPIVWSRNRPTAGSIGRGTEAVGFNKKVSVLLFHITTQGRQQGKRKLTQYSISPNVRQLLTASADGVTMYSTSITTPRCPRSNEPALTSSRRLGVPVYSRTTTVVVAFSSTIFNGRSRRKYVAVTTVVISNCPRHTV